MKRYSWLVLLTISVTMFSYCNSAKKATGSSAAATPTVFFDTDVKPLIEAKCTPCHVPSKGGRKEALDTYDGAKDHISDVIRRIEMNPDEKGFMPFKHPKLSETEINIFRKWKAEGMVKSK
jgi:hypothetical protein